MDGTQWAMLISTVVAMVSFPFALAWYRMRQNYRLERPLFAMIVVREGEVIRSKNPMRLASYRRAYSHLSDAKWLSKDYGKSVHLPELSSLRYLYCAVLF